MGRGGSRVGTGKKPKIGRILALHGGRDRGVTRPDGGGYAPIPMPEGLSDAVQAVWRELAPHATTAGTLTGQTGLAFRRLCQAIVQHGQWQAQIERDGSTFVKVTVDGAGVEHTELKAHPLIGKAQSLDTAIRSMLKDFACEPFGKPLAAPPKAVDPFAEFDQAAG